MDYKVIRRKFLYDAEWLYCMDDKVVESVEAIQPYPSPSESGKVFINTIRNGT